MAWTTAVILYLMALQVASLDNGLGRTPQMGWSSYNAFKCNITEDLILYSARRMKALGFQEAGYEYINVDDCWQSSESRSTTPGNIIAPHPERFPHGMKWLGDQLHDMGFKYGLYTGSGYIQCVSHTPASFGWEEQDAQTFAEYGVDYLKYDNCAQGVGSIMPAYDKFKIMSDAIKGTGRSIFLSLCQWGNAFPWFWADGIANSYRMSGDIWEYYNEQDDDTLCTCKTAYCVDPNPALCSVKTIIRKMRELTQYQKPGSWADMDMLEIGVGNMTLEEERTHFTYWAALKSPLIMGAAMHNISQAQTDIMTDKEVIAVSQDPLGSAAHFVEDLYIEGTRQVWAGRLTDGWVVLLTNEADEEQDLGLEWNSLKILPEHTAFEVRDVWKKAELGPHGDGIDFANVPAHGTKLLKLMLPSTQRSQQKTFVGTDAQKKDLPSDSRKTEL